MRPLVLASWCLCLLFAAVSSQNVGTQTQEQSLPMTISVCTAPGQCSNEQGGVVLDSNWRWTHTVREYSTTLVSTKLKGLPLDRRAATPTATRATCGTLLSARTPTLARQTAPSKASRRTIGPAPTALHPPVASCLCSSSPRDHTRRTSALVPTCSTPVAAGNLQKYESNKLIVDCLTVYPLGIACSSF